MTKLTMNRRSAMTLVAGAVLAGCVAGSAAAGNAGIKSGTYVGNWGDGSKLKEQVIYGEGHIRMTRIAGSFGVGRTSLYAPVGNKLYRDSRGATIYVESKRRFIWRRGDNQTVIYKLKK